MNAWGWGLFAVLLATATPIAMLLMREVIRRRRSALLDDLLVTLFKDKPNIPTLEFVRSKYGTGGLAPPDANTPAATQDENAARRSLIATRTLFFSAIPYLLLAVLGFLLLFEPACVLFSFETCTGNWIAQSLFWIENTGDLKATRTKLMNTAAIAGVAFLGAYLFTLRTLFRAVMNFELSPLTWLRAAIHVLTGVIIAILMYRTLHDTPYLTNLLQLSASPDSPLHLWLAIAFIAGYVPDFGLTTLIRRFRISYLKSVDDEVMKNVAIIPIEVIDGIDYDIRYRLEETNIVDVQNLATYNPIMLFVETPYGLYEAFDWVLQAQLCLVVGPKTFFELRKHKIRTILDLERAVLANNAPDPFVRMVGNLLYADANADTRKLITLKPASDSAPAELDVASIKHAVMVMGDDLHIHRLRQLWSEIHRQLRPDPASEWLYYRPPPAANS